ncbi:hypothetical protein B296_00049942, partial [Ensete ventricosum]
RREQRCRKSCFAFLALVVDWEREEYRCLLGEPRPRPIVQIQKNHATNLEGGHVSPPRSPFRGMQETNFGDDDDSSSSNKGAVGDGKERKKSTFTVLHPPRSRKGRLLRVLQSKPSSAIDSSLLF